MDIRCFSRMLELGLTRWQACDMCRKKKIKCDGKMPACTHCINYKTECVFTQVEKKRNPPKGYARLPHTNLQDVIDFFSGQNISKDSRTDWEEWRVCSDCLVGSPNASLKL
jgi:hypothetical protein